MIQSYIYLEICHFERQLGPTILKLVKTSAAANRTSVIDATATSSDVSSDSSLEYIEQRLSVAVLVSDKSTEFTSECAKPFRRWLFRLVRLTTAFFLVRFWTKFRRKHWTLYHLSTLGMKIWILEQKKKITVTREYIDCLLRHIYLSHSATKDNQK